MHNPTYLELSPNHIYYLRFPIPKALHPEGKHSSIRVTLATREPKEALKLARFFLYSGEDLLHRMKARLMDYQEIRAILYDHFKQLREEKKQSINQYGQFIDAVKRELEEEGRKAELALQEGDSSAVGNDQQLQEIIRTHEMPIEQNSKTYGTLRTEYQKAYRDYTKSVLDYNARYDSFDFTTHPSMLPYTIPYEKRRNSPKLAKVINDYCVEKLRLKQWREHIEKDYRTQFNLLLRILGEDAKIGVSRENAEHVKKILIHLPTNANKKAKYRDCSLEQLMAMDTPEAERLSPVTVAKNIRTFSTFFDWAVDKGHAEENNFKRLIDDAKKAGNERKGFSREDSKRILYKATKAKKHSQQWGTLIAFYTGARLNEVAQLKPADIIQREGIWCFDFTDEGNDDDKKRLKNRASKRKVPVHSKLIEAGFLEFVEEARKLNHARLFMDLSYEEKSGYGRNLGRWFNETLLRKQLAIKDPALVFHSIRHTVALQLRKNRIAVDVIRDVLGHTHEGVTLQVYAKEPDLKAMQEAIETLAY